jgi:thiamine biosynthesis lipoprotein
LSDFQFSLEALGSKWWFTIFDTLSAKDQKLLVKTTTQTLENFENVYSRFKPESLITLLNKDKILENYPDQLFEMLLVCNQANILTKGAFNIFVGSVLENSGYDKDYSFKQKKDASLTTNGSGFSIFSRDRLEISKNSSVDLGGIGKGWMIDKLVKIFQEDLNLNLFTINGGGDIFSTGDTLGAQVFQLENPKDSSQSIGQISLKYSAIACSSGNKRKWKDPNSGQEFNHLVTSDKSDKNILAVFTAASNAVQADLASTCLFVSDPENFIKICDFFETTFLLVFKDGTFFAHPEYPGKLNS